MFINPRLRKKATRKHGALALCLAFRYPQMWVLFGLMVLKEGYMVVMGLLFFRKGKMLNLKIS